MDNSGDHWQEAALASSCDRSCDHPAEENALQDLQDHYFKWHASNKKKEGEKGKGRDTKLVPTVLAIPQMKLQLEEPG